MVLLSSGMCGGRDQPADRAECRAVFLRGVEMDGRGRGVDGGPRGLTAGRAQDRHGAERVRVGRGHEGRSDGEWRGLRPRRLRCGDAAGAEGGGDAVDVVRGRQDGRDGGVVRGVAVHGVGGAARRRSAGVIVVRQAGRLPRGAGGRPRATAGINCGASRFPVRRVMRGRLSARGRAATAAGPPATGASPGRSAARSPGRRATA